jgi:hypothetical protein
MFAFFGLGMQELLILAALAGVVVIIAFVVILATRRSSSQLPQHVAELEEENRRLREQINERREPPK